MQERHRLPSKMFGNILYQITKYCSWKIDIVKEGFLLMGAFTSSLPFSEKNIPSRIIYKHIQRFNVASWLVLKQPQWMSRPRPRLNTRALKNVTKRRLLSKTAPGSHTPRTRQTPRSSSSLIFPKNRPRTMAVIKGDYPSPFFAFANRPLIFMVISGFSG